MTKFVRDNQCDFSVVSGVFDHAPMDHNFVRPSCICIYFILVNDACGCEGTPKLNEMIFCAMPEGKTVNIKPGTASVTGTIYVEEEKEEGVVVSLYTMAVDSVK